MSDSSRVASLLLPKVGLSGILFGLSVRLVLCIPLLLTMDSAPVIATEVGLRHRNRCENSDGSPQPKGEKRK